MRELCNLLLLPTLPRFFGQTGQHDAHLDITVTEYSGAGSGETVRRMEHFLVGDNKKQVPLFQSLIFNDTGLAWTLARTYRITLLSGQIILDYVRYNISLL